MPQTPFWLHVGISILFAVALSLLDLVEVAVVRPERVVGLFIGPIVPKMYGYGPLLSLSQRGVGSYSPLRPLNQSQPLLLDPPLVCLAIGFG
jgi:hypothetical protein